MGELIADLLVIKIQLVSATHQDSLYIDLMSGFIGSFKALGNK